MKYIADRTTRPIPRVLGYGLTADNPLPLGPFIIIEFVSTGALYPMTWLIQSRGMAVLLRCWTPTFPTQYWGLSTVNWLLTSSNSSGTSSHALVPCAMTALAQMRGCAPYTPAGGPSRQTRNALWMSPTFRSVCSPPSKRHTGPATSGTPHWRRCISLISSSSTTT